jgi:hypothetical protein
LLWLSCPTGASNPQILLIVRVAKKDLNNLGHLVELVRRMPPEQRRLFFALLQPAGAPEAPAASKFFSFTSAATLDMPQARRDYQLSLSQIEGHPLLGELSDEAFDQLLAQL